MSGKARTTSANRAQGGEACGFRRLCVMLVAAKSEDFADTPVGKSQTVPQAAWPSRIAIPARPRCRR